MPAVGSSAYAQVETILQGSRALLNDAPGNVFSDTFLLPYFNIAYQDLWTILEGNGQETFISDLFYFTVPAVNGIAPSAEVIVDETSVTIGQAPGDQLEFNSTAEQGPPNTLPPDLITPLRLWERQAGQQSFEFVPMQDRTSMGGLPSLPQGEWLGMWEWDEDGLHFPGALVDVQVRMRYLKSLAQVSDGTGQVLIRNSTSWLTYKTAMLGSKARGGAAAEIYKDDFTEVDFQLKNTVARRDQENPRRRRPYGFFSRWRGSQ